MKYNRRKFLQALGFSSFLVTLIGHNRLIDASSGLKSKGSVLVLGAGLSGLYSALLLEAQGFSVQVLEARDRIGGRVYTLDDIPGKPEAGGQVFSHKYQRLSRLTEELQIPTYPLNGLDRNVLLSINENLILAQDWSKSPVNRLNTQEKNRLPSRLMASYVRPNNPLTEIADWMSSEYWQWDISLESYLRQHGASAEALRLIDFYEPVQDTSTLWVFFEDLLFQKYITQPRKMEGGNRRLPEAMAAALKQSVQLQKVIEKITSTDEIVSVNCSDGTAYEADFAICTIPFPVLRSITIDPPLEGKQKEAVEQMPYSQVTQIYLSVNAPFWEEDRYPVSMWTDSSFEKILPQKNEQGEVKGLIGWAKGKKAQELDALSPKDLEFKVKKELQQIRPSTAGKIEISRKIAWGSDRFAQGAYHYFAPGQIKQFGQQVAQPWKRIHFAGEHTAVLSPGMESALESAERVVAEITRKA